MAVSLLLFFFFFSSSILVSITPAMYPWAPVEGQCLEDQKYLLLELKSELVFNSSKSYSLVMWNLTNDCCKWNGVDCDGVGRVIGLRLNNEGISGGIGDSSSLFRLTYLSYLSLSVNDFSQSQIANQFHRLKNLRSLDLYNAGLMGPIPSTLANLTQLEYLYLSYNFFTAPIPSFNMCSKLSSLDLRSNRIEGPIPNFIFQLYSLSSLWLSDNMFDGTFQLQNIQSLPRLMFLDLSYNNLSVETANLNLSSYGFPQLFQLGLSSCNLYAFPDLIRNQSDLLDLDLSNNRIGGEIPRWIWKTRMSELNLSFNILTDIEKPYHIGISQLLLKH